jgi:hypothetical protein
MIPVEFTMEPGVNIEEELKFLTSCMPWLKYLVDNCDNLGIEKRYEPAPHMNIVCLKFDLSPKKETYYLMKYR